MKTLFLAVCILCSSVILSSAQPAKHWLRSTNTGGEVVVAQQIQSAASADYAATAGCATNTAGGVLRLGPVHETTLSSDASGLTIANVSGPAVVFGAGGPKLQAVAGVLASTSNLVCQAGVTFPAAAAITPVAPGGGIAIQNVSNVLYAVSATRTNVISDCR